MHGVRAAANGIPREVPWGEFSGTVAPAQNARDLDMVGIRNVISTLTADGREVMGPNVLLFHHPESAIVSGSLLTVESNHFCVLKARGAVLNVYETGQYPVQTP